MSKNKTKTTGNVKTNFAEVMRMIDIMLECKEYLAIGKIKAKINGIQLDKKDYEELQKMKSILT